MYSSRYIQDEYLAHQYNTLNNMKHESIVQDWRKNYHLPDSVCKYGRNVTIFGSSSIQCASKWQNLSFSHEASAAKTKWLSSGKAQVITAALVVLTTDQCPHIKSMNRHGHMGLVFSVFLTLPKNTVLQKWMRLSTILSPHHTNHYIMCISGGNLQLNSPQNTWK